MRRFLVILGAFGLAAGLATGTFFLRSELYRGEALPGVRVVQAHLGKPVDVLAGGKRIRVVPSQVLRLDTGATRAAAHAAGRASLTERVEALLLPLPPQRVVEPVLRLRPQQWNALTSRLDALGEPARDARVRMNGLAPVVTRSQPGTKVDRALLLNGLVAHVQSGHSVIRARYVPAAPAIGDTAARRVAAAARTAVATPVQLRLDGAVVGSLAPDTLAPLLRFRPYRGTYVIQLDRARLADAVRPLVQSARRTPVDASFAVSGARVHVVPARNGVDVDPARTASAVVAALGPENRVADVALHSVAPKLTTAAAQKLGIRQQLVTYTTQMGTSSSNRIHNVHLMADFIDGTIIEPGDVFSFNERVGPRTAERGFLEGQQIVGSLTLPAIGGGVCQTATTLFNDAFELGLPILERQNHGYYLYHYPLGRDATVSWGGPDLKFRNDLQHALLIKTSYTDTTLTFTFYGTPQGRRVVSQTGPQTNWTAPKMSYAVDPQAAPGSIQVVPGSGEQGFDVTVSRTVYEHGKVLRQDSFASHYIPVGPTTVYGPGATPPGPYVVLPPH